MAPTIRIGRDQRGISWVQAGTERWAVVKKDKPISAEEALRCCLRLWPKLEAELREAMGLPPQPPRTTR
jgi:hypothetical protein